MNRDDCLVELLVQFEEAVSGGTPVTPEDVCREYPELLPEFLQLLKNIGAVNAALEGESADSVNPDRLFAGVEAGRYRPLGFHDAGGMGVVFTAEDDEVGRLVALKCMQGWAATDETARNRFLQEAEVTGRLEHPGIVPVYGLGRDRSGRPYYAMRFISGKTLRDEIRGYHDGPANDSERVVEFRRLLRAFTTVCETVAYAHARGVIHRDLKPGNIMLGPYGETLLVDWGLAKRVGVPDPEATVDPGMEPLKLGAGEAPSMRGVPKGTPGYMSPEQACGETDRVGPASDVFGLGATLYAILTGRAPYEGSSAQAQARTGQFVPPRQHRRAVPRPLEAICLKAMAIRPEDRYPGAKELARDLERWLADEPVSAWREPFLWRARRWAKHHRTLLTALVASLLVAVVGLASLAALEARKNQQLQQANSNLDAAKTKADRSYSHARQAARGLAEYAMGAPGLRHAAFVGISDTAARSEGSEKGLQEARLAFRLLLEDHPDDLENQADLASVCQLLGIVYEARGRPNDALQALAEARDLHTAIQQSDPKNPRAAFGQILAHLAEGRLHLKAGDGKKGEPFYQNARAALEALVRESGDDDGLRFARANILQSLATVRALDGQWRETIALSEQARTILADLVVRHPSETMYREELARCDYCAGNGHSRLGNEAFLANRTEESLAHFERAQVLLHPLARERSQLPDFRTTYETHLKLWTNAVLRRSGELWQKQKTVELLGYFEKALPMWEERAREEQSIRDLQVLVVRLRVGLADTCLTRANQLDPMKVADVREIRRLVAIGLDALDKLPSQDQKTPGIPELRLRLQFRAGSLPALKE